MVAELSVVVVLKEGGELRLPPKIPGTRNYNLVEIFQTKWRATRPLGLIGQVAEPNPWLEGALRRRRTKEPHV